MAQNPRKLKIRACGTVKIKNVVANAPVRVANAPEKGKARRNTKLLGKYRRKTVDSFVIEKHQVNIPASIDPLLFKRAKAFLNVSQHAGDYHESLVKTVLQAFACELYLKGLLGRKEQNFEIDVIETESGRRQANLETIEFNYDRGHNLLDLFEKLEERLQSELATKYYEQTSHRDIKSDLAHCDKLFVDARYDHEKGVSYCPSILNDLAYFFDRYTQN